MSGRYKGVIGSLCIGVSLVALTSGVVYADTLSSSNYQFDESTLGSGGLIQSGSANYRSDSVLGDLAIGNSASTSYQVEAGNVTNAYPGLSFSILNANAALGSFSPTSSSTATATFAITNYTSYGYVVQLTGNPPTNGASAIDPLVSQTAPSVGNKQFGVNLVANTSPASVGANPLHGLFAIGSATPNYATPNQYRYVSGDTIASAPASSGQTTYTMTYMVNVDSLTIGGQYSSNQTLIVTGTY
ncbi:MAG: hypothetical protein ABIR46_03555 [Candidatus Saccharimonadales bacterium]